MSDHERVCAGRETQSSRPRVLLLFTALLLVAPAWAHAYVMPISLQELSDRAEIIVHGIVVNVATGPRGVEINLRIQSTLGAEQ
jgi:hypothetical protein